VLVYCLGFSAAGEETPVPVWPSAYLALRRRRKLARPHPHTEMYVSITGIFNIVSYPEKPDKRFLPEPTHSLRAAAIGVLGSSQGLSPLVQS
jgi:hypothetical protein